jgi:NAD(P)-dependent dehydrogenase (short-subunit alcohol dehydrogenase family)
MTEMLDLKDRVAVITGGGGVLGKEFAGGLAAQGARIVVADINGEAAREAADVIAEECGVETLGLVADVSQPEDVANLVDETMSAFGSIDIVINNAAGIPTGLFEPFEDFALETWNQMLATNLTAMFLVAQAAGRVMVEQKRGSIINICSIYGVVGPDQRVYEDVEFNTPVSYSVSKAGVIGLTKYLATYWGDKGIRVNAVTPGGVLRGHTDPFLSKYCDRVPMGRMAEQHEIVGAVVFLASDASSYVTGHNLIVDGGLTAW